MQKTFFQAKNILLSAFLLFAAAVSASGQTNTGNLVVSVSDPAGVIPGATVTVTDNQTNRTRTVTTNESGTVTIPQLEVGTYTVRIESPGRKAQVSNDVVIDIGKTYDLNAVLEVGDVSATVEVAAGQDLVNTTSAELSNTVTTRQITELPLNGRNPLALIQLQPGTASNPNQNTSINGFRTSSSNIVQDGINVQDNFIRSNATDFSPARSTVDNVDQFTITTQAGADRGFGGPQIELVTPRGQNAFHGALFVFNRNSKFGANTFFNNATGSFASTDLDVVRGFRQAGEARNPRPFLNRNQFGGRLTGPIIKNKLFFFGYYEGLRQRNQVSKLTTVLTPEARAGIFRYQTAGGIQSVNVFTATTAAGSVNAPTAINPTVTTQFLNRLPNGNSSETGDQLNTTGYRFNQRGLTDRNQYTTRIDYDINDKNSINGVYDQSHEDNFRTDIDTSFNTTPVVIQPADNKRLALAYRTSPLANFTNELRGGFFFSDPVFLRTEANPAFFINPTLITNPDVTFQDQGRSVKTYNLNDTADYILGNHSLRFGFQYQNVEIVAFNNAGIVPTFNLGTGTATPSLAATSFPGINNTQLGTANALYALLGGIVPSGGQTFNVTSRESGFEPNATQTRTFTYSMIAPFINDSWRVTPQLTLNLGLRYDYFTALKSPNGLFLEPVIGDRDPVEAILDPNGRYQYIGGNAGAENAFYKADKNNFAPVVSFAYSPGFGGGIGRLLFGEQGESVIRGGFRLSYVNDELVRAPDNALGGNAGLQVTQSALVGGSTALNARLGSALPSIPTPAFLGDNRTFAQNNTAAFSNFGTVFGVDPNLQVPYYREYNIGYSRQFGNYAFEARYVGTSSDSLLRGIDYNQVDIRNNGFLADFLRARENCRLQALSLNPNNTINQCTSAAFNSTIPGSQPLTVFPNLGLINGVAGGTNNATILNQIRAGTPADLAAVYIQNGFAGTVRFLPNPNTGVADLLQNGAISRYNSLQLEMRRRFAQGYEFQANYTLAKTLTDAVGTGQTRFEPLLDNEQPDLEYSRADYDQSHIFNFNTIAELPFGKGKRFFNQGGFVDALLGGFQVTSIIRLASGSPITFTDARGTLNRAARSGRQTALTNLTKEELKNLVGVFRTDNGVFFINPTALGRDPQTGLLTGSNTGRGANGFGTPNFEGQVFFNNAPGQTSGLERAVVNGPIFFNWDASLIKNIRFTERTRLQLRGEAFNVLNRTNFITTQFYDINSANFGRISATPTPGGVGGPRIFQFGARFEF